MMIFDRLSVIPRNVQAMTGSPRVKKIRPYLLQMSGWLPLKYANRRKPRLEKKKTLVAITPPKSGGAIPNFGRPPVIILLINIRAAARDLLSSARLVGVKNLYP